MAVGIFVGMTPTLGVQMIIAAFVATLLGASRVPAVLMVYISNPLTAVPLYSLCYNVGAAVLEFWFKVNTPGWGAARADFALLADRGLFGILLGVIRMSWRLALPLWTGSVVLGITGALITYPLAVRFLKGHRLVKAQKRARRMARQDKP